MAEKKCRTCGSIFRTKTKERECCSEACQRHLDNIRTSGTVIKRSKKKKELSSLAKKNAKARSRGMSYGQYVAWLESEKERKRRETTKRRRSV